ncbi:hypothetical protein CONPUDRAFT_139698 [Coniophora puteana RWD-64-598 SS2]|uniref:[histone H3]-trimethyl-L-lysine(4) demethylase n=1 Tax=Coniophora puteana (strain RWD-64-598) TaxID=741705 RepID=A0A5M3MCC6_CONPW|nr:uncharacterized protein CONPUDRAFT_139698 [Coniophora puteana RWD-64-598 SS2]EIW76301.1 hypothetical protein CONPUDRAFT_139698 [Coniophora puteana RWD-64-598 SS2]
MDGNSPPPSARGTPARRGRPPKNANRTPVRNPDPATPVTSPTDQDTSVVLSSMDIRVAGTTPIVSADGSNQNTSGATNSSSVASAPNSRRGSRKAKTDAIAAMQASSTGDESDDPQLMGALRNSMPIEVAPVLNLASVKTISPRELPPRSTPRPFGLEDCPAFYPTPEEFKDPMAYIRKISDKATEYGICKVVPPVGWKMPFVTDTESFRFKTRLQRLNSIEASSRAKVNFLEQLYRFHKQQGNPRVSVPTINHRPLDLWLLRKEVHKLGGYEAVTKMKKWSDLGALLGYRGIPGLSTQIRNSYTRVILPYEHYCERVRNSTTLSPSVQRDPSRAPGDLWLADFGKIGKSTSSPPSSPLTASSSSPLSEPPEDGRRGRRSARMSTDRMTTPVRQLSEGGTTLPSPAFPSPSFREAKREPPKDKQEQSCEICQKKNRGEEMLLCDGCDCGFHMFCLDPPLSSIPKGQWFCHTCLLETGGDFGFDEGEEHSLSTLQVRDAEFRRMWWSKHAPNASVKMDYEPNDPTVTRVGDTAVSEEEVEQEFWRLVQSPDETVEVEYGADVHSTTHGSAMPTMETHPLDPMAKDPWNLNNMPIVSDSLLRYIKSDISGMTVPWTYVGMVFSTFCWHNEDHYTYSINFMHWGETKTWYGIPGDDAEKFEAAIKSEAPDLFEAQPDLLFQLVTLMNPARLTEAGVRVYACNQRAGEFVITFPKAYHAGFNHGFNFNEAVNFALPDWLRLGRDCVERYREHRKLPVFSHDELLITITQQSQSIKTAIWLADSLREMVVRELGERARVRKLGMKEVLEEADKPEDQYQCAICKMFCYLSQVTCQCKKEVVCADHVDLLCEHNMSQLTLRLRFSDGELQDTLSKVVERSEVPGAWKKKLQKVLEESALPPLRSLRALLAEGERINYPLPELPTLRKCVQRANEWVDSANGFIIRKQSRKRSRKRGRPSHADIAANAAAAAAAAQDERDPGDRPDRTLSDLYALLREAENLGFDAPELGVLEALARQAEDISANAQVLCRQWQMHMTSGERDALIKDSERLLLDASSLNVYLDPVLEIEKVVSRERLLDELGKSDDDSKDLDEVRRLLTRARACDLAPDNKYVQRLEARHRAGADWEERARMMLEQPGKTIEELQELLGMTESVPTDPTIHDRLKSALAKAMDFDKQAKGWATADGMVSKPTPSQLSGFIARCEKDFHIPSVKNLSHIAQYGREVEDKCDAVLRNRYPHTEKDVFKEIEEWGRYARQHLSMLSLPFFQQLDKQLNLHYRWLEDLPWYCKDHPSGHGSEILDDVIEATRPEDDLPPTDEYFTCICQDPVRPPPPGGQSDAVQCDHCFARFHGKCAANGGSCPFCDHNHWNGKIHKERNWHFCFLPLILTRAPDLTHNYSDTWKQLEIIVHRVDRLSSVIGHFLTFASQAGNQKTSLLPQVRHYMRKLYKIQFAVSPSREISFGLDLAGLHRILAGLPTEKPHKKRRKPKLVFGPDADEDWYDGTRCVCRRNADPKFLYTKMDCDHCKRRYHAPCVRVTSTPLPDKWTCPLCCVRKNKSYPFAEVRVKRADDDRLTEMWVNMPKTYEMHGQELIVERMPLPRPDAIVLDLVSFTPWSPSDSRDRDRTSTTNGTFATHGFPTPVPTHSPPNQRPSSSHSHHQPPSPAPTPPRYWNGYLPNRVGPNPYQAMSSVPPPPPWNSSWHNLMATTGARPSGVPPEVSAPSMSATTSSSSYAGKKRKFIDEPGPERPESSGSTNGTAANNGREPSPKQQRRSVPHTPVPPPATVPNKVQTLSPSLAMIVSPVDTEPSPRPAPVPRPSSPPPPANTSYNPKYYRETSLRG